MMLKQTQPLQESIATEPETPPLEMPSQPTPSSQLIHRIIASNEALIHQQMAAIRDLQTSNADLEEKLKVATQKYDALFDLAFGGKQTPTSNRTEESSVQQQQDSPQVPQRLTVETLLGKITELEQQLSTAKVELAVKSAELLTAAFQHSQEDSAQKRRKTMAPEASRVSIEQYFEPQPINRQEDISRKQTPENKEGLQAWSKLLEQYGSEQKASKFKEKSLVLIRKGIPRSLRGRCWGLLVENRLGMTNALYIQLLQRRQRGWVCEKVRLQVDKDIKRSFYGKTSYETKTGFILEVVEFLEIFHVFRPDVSYVQGMTYPAMVLIPVLGKIRAFTLFCNLVLANSFFRRLFAMEGSFVSAICRGFQGLLEQCLPGVGNQLSSMGIQSEIYLIEWLFTFFSRGLSLEAILRFWDQLLYHQEVAIFRMALSIFQQLAPALQGLNYEESVECVRDYGSHVKEEKVIEGLANSKITAEKMYRAIERVKV